MRSRRTNFLQLVILISGIIYVVTGAIFTISPHLFGSVFSLEINEDWFKEIPKDPFMFTVLSLSRATAALLFSAGLAMILPLFDPLKYRGLVYYTGVIFPIISSFIFIQSSLENPIGVIIVYAVVFPVILLLTVTGLVITKDSVRSGVE